MKEKFFLIITLLFLQISTSAQKNKDQVENSKVNNIFFATGITLPIANDIADVYAYGFSAKIGVSFNIYKQNLFIEPSFSFNGFNKDIAYSSAYDKTKIFSVSLPIALKILPNFTNNSLFLLSSIDYNFISNDISSKSFDLFSFSKSNNRTNIMKGKGISFLFGIRYHIIS